MVPLGSVSGTWQGTSRSYSNEIRKITLRITQIGLKISGDYSCVPHNAACRNLDDGGTLSGKLTRNYFAVMIVMWPDHSQCYFTGTVAESLILGDYECLEGARIVEIGRWQVKRSGCSLQPLRDPAHRLFRGWRSRSAEAKMAEEG